MLRRTNQAENEQCLGLGELPLGWPKWIGDTISITMQMVVKGRGLLLLNKCSILGQKMSFCKAMSFWFEDYLKWQCFEI